MTLWTIHPVSFWHHFNLAKCVRGSIDFVEEEDVDAYRWMLSMLQERTDAECGTSPIWAWHTYDGQTSRRPDLRSSGHLPRGSQGVRIELEICEESILLSQFEMWVWVMTQDYIPEGTLDFEEWHSRTRNSVSDQQLCTKSWERIFDLQFGDPDFWGPHEERSIQACIGSISLDDVNRVDFFQAR